MMILKAIRKTNRDIRLNKAVVVNMNYQLISVIAYVIATSVLAIVSMVTMLDIESAAMGVTIIGAITIAWIASTMYAISVYTYMGEE